MSFVKTHKLPGGIGYRRSGYEFWYDRKVRMWTVWDPVSTDVLGYEISKRLAEDLIDKKNGHL